MVLNVVISKRCILSLKIYELSTNYTGYPFMGTFCKNSLGTRPRRLLNDGGSERLGIRIDIFCGVNNFPAGFKPTSSPQRLSTCSHCTRDHSRAFHPWTVVEGLRFDPTFSSRPNAMQKRHWRPITFPVSGWQWAISSPYRTSLPFTYAEECFVAKISMQGMNSMTLKSGRHRKIHKKVRA